jgi:hypothetical protein
MAVTGGTVADSSAEKLLFPEIVSEDEAPTAKIIVLALKKPLAVPRVK